MRNRMAFAIRGCVAIATASLLGAGIAQAQPGPTSGMAGGTSDGYASVPDVPASRENTPDTGGGPTTLIDRSERDQLAAKRDARSSGTVAGTVRKLDTERRTLQLSGTAGNARTLKVDRTAEVTRNGEQASFSDIKEGDQVRASLSGTGDEPMVTHIDLVGPDARSTRSSQK